MIEKENQKTYFSQIADIYDGQQPLLIRKYNQVHDLIVRMIGFEGQTPFSVVDLGCGTGTLAQMILQTYSSASVTCMDISPEMLSIARRKLAEFGDRAEFIVEDLGKAEFQKNYDVAVSIYAIHHLPHPRKKKLFGKIYEILSPNGMFLFADSIRIGTATLKDRNIQFIREHIQRLIRGGKVSIEEINRRRDIKKAAEKHGIEKDYLCTFDELDTILRDSGFGEVECFWRYFDDVIFIACKEKGEISTEEKWLELVSEDKPKRKINERSSWNNI
jgi:tRNA (cmo5U34)-methyltransferase